MKKTKNQTSLLDKIPHHGYQFGKAIDRIVNLCTYAVILSLVGYMIARIVKSFWLVFQAMFTGVAEGIMSFSAPEEAIQTVPITIILVKAYKLLIEYAKTQHVSIKYVLEIAITAPVVEIIFSFSHYDHVQLIFMGGFAVVTSMVYLFFYEKIKQYEEDYTKAHLKRI